MHGDHTFGVNGAGTVLDAGIVTVAIVAGMGVRALVIGAAANRCATHEWVALISGLALA